MKMKELLYQQKAADVFTNISGFYGEFQKRLSCKGAKKGQPVQMTVTPSFSKKALSSGRMPSSVTMASTPSGGQMQ